VFAPFLFAVVAAATTTALPPRAAIALRPAIGHFVFDVAWENADAVLIASDEGVQRYSLRSRSIDRLVSTADLPDGLPYPEAVASDGTTVEVTSSLTMGGYSMRLANHKRIAAQRVRLQPHDVAVRGSRACVLGSLIKEQTNEAVWCGPVDKLWTRYQPVHRIASGARIFRNAISRFGGAIAMSEDGSVTVVTSAEPGVFRYAPDGKLLEKSGESFDQLVLSAMQELHSRFAGDVPGRYRLLLNTQPILEDLVLTPRGPALVVRVAEKDRVRWELWWPRSDGRTVPPTRLGIDRIGPYGHLQCDARGRSLACVGSLPDRKQAADFDLAERVPYLWIFELPQ
jgi:hypothetical protein